MTAVTMSASIERMTLPYRPFFFSSPHSAFRIPQFLSVLFFSAVFLQVLAHTLHGTELTAHGADVGLLRHARFAEPPRTVGIDRKLDLAVPVERLPAPCHLPVPVQGALHALGDVGGVGRYPGCDHALAHVFEVREPEVLRRRYVAEKIRA